MYELFQKLIDSKGITAYKVAKETGISTVTFTNWKNGKYIPKNDKMQRIANYLGVDIDFLYGKEESTKDNIKTKKGTKIPVLGIVPCGVPIDAIEYIIDYEEIPEEMAKQGTYFALIAKGDSMSPTIIDGDVLIIKQVSKVDSGKIAIIKINGEEATCKKVLLDETGITVVPLNRNYDPLRFTNEQIKKLPVAICGQVVESRRKLL